METELIEKLIENGIVTAILGYIGIVLWRKYDGLSKQTKEELKEAMKTIEALRNKIETEIITSRSEILNVLERSIESTNTIREDIKTISAGYKSLSNRNIEALKCLTAEIEKLSPNLKKILQG